MLGKISFRLLLLSLIAVVSGLIFNMEKASPTQKFDYVWRKINLSSESSSWYSTLELAQLFLYDMNISFDTYNEWMPAGRKKLIHSVGVVAKAKWVALPHQEKYTGLFHDGSESVIIRLSSAKKPEDGRQGETDLTPGIAIKVFRQVYGSTNIIAMYSLDGQKSVNFFLNDFSNHVEDPTDPVLSLLKKKFESASKHPGKYGLSDASRVTASGHWLHDCEFPYRLVLKPSPVITKRVQDNISAFNAATWMKQFELVEEGELLYEIWAYENPQSSVPTHIGNLVMQSSFTKTSVGDRELFFRHNRFEDDLSKHPEWESSELVQQL